MPKISVETERRYVRKEIDTGRYWCSIPDSAGRGFWTTNLRIADTYSQAEKASGTVVSMEAVPVDYYLHIKEATDEA